MGEAISSKMSSVPLVVVQEGGYGVDVLANNVKAFLMGMQGIPLPE